MPLNPQEVYKLKQQGKIVPTKCRECGELVWSNQAMFLQGAQDWVCESCQADAISEATGGLLGEE